MVYIYGGSVVCHLITGSLLKDVDNVLTRVRVRVRDSVRVRVRVRLDLGLELGFLGISGMRGKEKRTQEGSHTWQKSFPCRKYFRSSSNPSSRLVDGGGGNDQKLPKNCVLSQSAPQYACSDSEA